MARVLLNVTGFFRRFALRYEEGKQNMSHFRSFHKL